jgi:hypothetical protein
VKFFNIDAQALALEAAIIIVIMMIIFIHAYGIISETGICLPPELTEVATEIRK